MNTIKTGHSAEVLAQSVESQKFSTWHASLSEAERSLYREAMDSKNDSDLAGPDGTINSLFSADPVCARELKPEHLEILERRKGAIGY